MRRTFIHSWLVTFCLVLSLDSAGQVNLVAYEYWFDGDYANLSSVAVAPTPNLELTTDIAPPGLDPGIHWLFIRFQDDAGLWSPAMSKMFFIPPAPPQNDLQELMWWIDGDVNGAITLPLTGTSFYLNENLNTASLAHGFHTLSVRFRTDEQHWSPPLTRRFYARPSWADNKIEHYRYWFDDDLGNLFEVDIDLPEATYQLINDLPTATLPQGLGYKISIQFRDQLGQWSPVLEGNFNKIVGCWGDMNSDGQVNTSDLLILLAGFGCMSACTIGDVNFDDQVNTADLLLLLSLFQSDCE